MIYGQKNKFLPPLVVKKKKKKEAKRKGKKKAQHSDELLNKGNQLKV